MRRTHLTLDIIQTFVFWPLVAFLLYTGRLDVWVAVLFFISKIKIEFKKEL